MTDRYIIVGRVSCPFCVKAVDYCKAKSAEFIFLDYVEMVRFLKNRIMMTKL